MKTKNAKKPLSVEIIDGQLVISIGVSTLIHAVQMGNGMDDFPGKITDAEGFAKDILSELQDEEEGGLTPVHKMLDEAARKAAEQGSQHVSDADGED